jgi:hypothetical protein
MSRPVFILSVRKQGIDCLYASLLVAALFGALLTVPTELLAQGCAMCKTIGGAEDPLARGLNVSILFLVSMPFFLLGSVGGWFYYLYRRSRRHMPMLRLVQTAKEGTP